MIYPKTEKEQRDKFGTLVRTTEITDDDSRKRGFFVPSERTSNCEGVIIDYSNSHGLCFRVRHVDGGCSWYDYDELIEI